MYHIKEIYYTIQGEGGQTGRPAVFCRFSGCNLWSGREIDREKAICRFCDTDFWGTDGENGGKYGPVELAEKAGSLWPVGLANGRPLVVCTGGEPMLQLDEPLVEAFHALGFEVAIETNGTIPVVIGVDWICVSPKAGTEILQKRGQELKLVYPQTGIDPAAFEAWDFGRYYLQPMDGPDVEQNIQICIRYCLDHPLWNLSLQTHKFAGLK